MVNVHTISLRLLFATQFLMVFRRWGGSDIKNTLLFSSVLGLVVLYAGSIDDGLDDRSLNSKRLLEAPSAVMDNTL